MAARPYEIEGTNNDIDTDTDTSCVATDITRRM
jgi:hypothetical protein